MKLTNRDFLKAGQQRFLTAEFLLENEYNLDALYLAGYAVECALKALILEATPIIVRPHTLERISRGRSMHDFEALAGMLQDLDRPIPGPIRRRFRRFEWDTSLRYETGRRRTGEVKGFHKTARMVLDWVEGQIP